MNIKRTAIATVAAATLITGVGFGATAANAASATPSVSASTSAGAGVTPQGDLPIDFTIDPTQVASMIKDAVETQKNKGAFVANLLNESVFNVGQQHFSVMVANLGEHTDVDVHNVAYYASATYTDGTIYGIWFLNPGGNTFTNNGDMGYENWSWSGAGWTRSDDKRTVTFS